MLEISHNWELLFGLLAEKHVWISDFDDDYVITAGTYIQV